MVFNGLESKRKDCTKNCFEGKREGILELVASFN
ncbi:MAG: hypothetical protein ACJA19_001824 [Bacteroidia bacterium]